MQTINKPLNLDHIEKIVFDLDGTLYSASSIEYQIKPNMVKHAARVLQIDEDSAQKQLAMYRKEFRSSVIGLRNYHGIDPEAFLDEVFSNIDTSKAVPYLGIIGALKDLAEYYPLTLWTNSSRGHAHCMIRQFQLEDVFQQVFSVEYWGFIRKPHLEVFDGLLKKLDIQGSSALVFDDSYLNLETAHQKGMQTILVSNHIVQPPYFWEMHREEEHQAPSFVNIATHDITSTVREIIERRA